MPDTFTEGQTKEEALFNAAEVLSVMLARRLDEAKDIPAPTLKIKGAHYIAADAKTQAAMLLRLARGERSFSEMARALEASWSAAKRLENPAHWPSRKTLDRAAAASGTRLVLSLEQPVGRNARSCDLCERQRHLMERLFGETTH